MGSEMPESCLKSDSVNIREVWDDNLEQEFALIRDIVDEYPYIAMDTEFPGIVLASLLKDNNDQFFHALKANVDLLKLIQLGLTFSDEKGNLPTCGTGKYCIWQFNFREFNLNEDAYAIDSIELLKRCGIDFEKNSQKGVDARRFSELLMSSGVVLNDSVVWVTFHSAYDFGYLLKVLSWKSLPETQAGYFELLRIYFPVYYDIKYMLRFCNGLYGGLSKVAEMLNIERIGMCHQAGSDSLLTSALFMKLKRDYFSESLEKFVGLLYGIVIESKHSN